MPLHSEETTARHCGIKRRLPEQKKNKLEHTHRVLYGCKMIGLMRDEWHLTSYIDPYNDVACSLPVYK